MTIFAVMLSCAALFFLIGITAALWDIADTLTKWYTLYDMRKK